MTGEASVRGGRNGRERQRELQSWACEDQTRTFEHRREVLEDFYQAVKALARRAYDHG